MFQMCSFENRSYCINESNQEIKKESLINFFPSFSLPFLSPFFSFPICFSLLGLPLKIRRWEVGSEIQVFSGVASPEVAFLALQGATISLRPHMAFSINSEYILVSLPLLMGIPFSTGLGSHPFHTFNFNFLCKGSISL